MGDAAGVGPELCLRLLAEPALRERCVPLVFGSAALLRRVAAATGLPAPAVVFPAAGPPPDWAPVPAVVDCLCEGADGIVPGLPQAAAGRAAFQCVRSAVGAVLAGRAAALVTAPLNKAALHLAGVPYPGHTEMLAELTGARDVRMAFVCDELLVGLATTHVPAAAVPVLLTRAGVALTIRMTAAVARRRGAATPRVVVCGLNPHAGEGGLFGREELDVIAPAIEDVRADGDLALEGPVPADTAFLPERIRRTDAYVVMYHDQGLIPFKMLAFDRGVNVTLGLPLVRASPDHGTAFDIAWRGSASSGSMRAAVAWAVRLAAPT